MAVLFEGVPTDLGESGNVGIGGGLDGNWERSCHSCGDRSEQKRAVWQAQMQGVGCVVILWEAETDWTMETWRPCLRCLAMPLM